MALITIPGAEQAASGWNITDTLRLLGLQGKEGITPGPYTPPPGTPTTTGIYSTSNGQRTIQQMRDELYKASRYMDYWKNAPDDKVISEYAKVTGGAVTPVTGSGEEILPYPDWWRQLPDYGLPLGPQEGVYPTLETQRILSDPSRIGQALIMLYGGQPSPTVSAAKYLWESPLVQQLRAGHGLPSPNVAQQQGWDWREEDYQWNLMPSGRHLPVRETLQQFQQQQTGGASPLLDLYGSLAAFSGQNVGDFYGDFWSAAPQGSKNPLTRWAY